MEVPQPWEKGSYCGVYGRFLARPGSTRKLPTRQIVRR